jgi:hypothetical protein
MSLTWPKTIDFGQEKASLENGQKTHIPKTEIAKGFWPSLRATPITALEISP